MEQSRLSKKERHALILSEVRRSASIRISGSLCAWVSPAKRSAAT